MILRWPCWPGICGTMVLLSCWIWVRVVVEDARTPKVLGRAFVVGRPFYTDLPFSADGRLLPLGLGPLVPFLNILS